MIKYIYIKITSKYIVSNDPNTKFKIKEEEEDSNTRITSKRVKI